MGFSGPQGRNEMTKNRPIVLRAIRAVAVAACLTLGASAALAQANPQLHQDLSAAASEPGEVFNGWIADEADNVCGVRVARQVTNPVSVRYEELLEATPEMLRMKREGISRDSAQGQVLYAGAVDRVRKAATRIMGSGAYCSIWKQIRHRDGRSVHDVTSDVKSEL